MSIHDFHGKQRPIRGTARGLLLALRKGQPYRGPVSRLAQLVGTSEAAVWRALIVLDAEKLVMAANDGPGLVWLAVTRKGRLVRV
jgi:DNA-binding IclR family transcriptional regulator